MALTWSKKRKQVIQYSKIAPIYDHLMHHVDYEEWANYIVQLLNTYSDSVETFLDASCGTGNFVFELSKQTNFELKGFDFTFEMVAIALKKARKRNLSIPFWCGDMSCFALQHPQDAIVSLYDSINYLMNIDKCKQFYERCYQNLKPGGILIFDICTEWNSIINFQHYEDQEQTKDAKIIRKSYYDQENRIHFNDFRIKFRNDSTVFRELHRQKIYYIAEIVESVPIDKFVIKGIYDGFTRREGTENSERVHFVLKKVD